MGLILWLSTFQACPVSLILKLQMPHRSHHHRVLSIIFYSHCCATHRHNRWYAPPGKFRFKFLRNALQQPCFCTWKDNTYKRPGLKCTNSILSNSENEPRGLYFSKALFEGLIYGGKFVFQNQFS